MKADKYRFDGSKKCKLSKLPTNAKSDDVNKEEIVAKFAKNLQKLGELQNCFYADKREGLIIVLQALDAAGKDSLIRRVATGMNPQGVKVYCCKAPSSEELSHDYLWRINKSLPARGEVEIYNRSWYEDIIAAAQLHLKDHYAMKPRVIGQSEDDFIDQRIEQVRNYESYLYQNSYRVIKVFLHVSKDVQRERFLERIDREDKNWKFSKSDLGTRQQFDEYMDKYERVINKTATEECPWYAIPADNKWYARYLLSEILIDAFEDMASEYPVMPEEERKYLADCKAALLEEAGTSDELIRKENATAISGDGKVEMDLYDDGVKNDSWKGEAEMEAKDIDKAGKKAGKDKAGKDKSDKSTKKARKDSDKKDKKDKKSDKKSGKYERITDLDA